MSGRAELTRLLAVPARRERLAWACRIVGLSACPFTLAAWIGGRSVDALGLTQLVSSCLLVDMVLTLSLRLRSLEDRIESATVELRLSVRREPLPAIEPGDSSEEPRH